MTSLTKDELNEIIDLSPFENDMFNTFIETGTYRGETIFTMEPFFDTLHTIEIKKEFYENCRANYKGNKITFHLGDSSNILPKILPDIQGNVVFFLDGHWSSKDTGRGSKDVPLFEELKAINLLLHGKAILVIDDYRLFGRHPNAIFKFKYHTEDWKEINKRGLVTLLKSRLIASFVHGDRFTICIRGNDPLITASRADGDIEYTK